MSTKILGESFIDWEADTFGYGYGTGEPHTIAALRHFLELCSDRHGNGVFGYDHEQLEAVLTPTVTWLLINTLCHVNILEYGTSPRFAWLTESGKALRDFMLNHTVDQICNLTNVDEGWIPCSRTACNCGPNGYQAGVKCDNPFWNVP